MELLFSDLPTEVIDIITNYIKLINFLNHFNDKPLGFKPLLNLAKQHNCILIVKFNDDNDYIPDSLVIYGEYMQNYRLDRTCIHPFIVAILNRGYSWRCHDLDIQEKNILRGKHIELWNTWYILKIKFMLVDTSIQEYRKIISNKNTLIINDY